MILFQKAATIIAVLMSSLASNVFAHIDVFSPKGSPSLPMPSLQHPMLSQRAATSSSTVTTALAHSEKNAAPAIAESIGHSPSDELTKKTSNAFALITEANQKGYVSVTVDFSPPASVHTLDPNNITNLQLYIEQVHNLQNAILKTCFGTISPTDGPGFSRALKRFDVTPAFSIRVTRSELEALAADPLVTHIQQNTSVHSFN